MRVTNSMMMTNFMSNINRNMGLMSKYQDQLASGRRMQRLSDDPVGIMSVLDSRSKLSRLDINDKTIEDAKSWLTQTETALNEMNDVISLVYEKTVNATNDSTTPYDRKAMADLVEQMREHIVQLGNSTYGGRYIFGGFNTTASPFQYNASGVLEYNGSDLSANPPTALTTLLQTQHIQYATAANVDTVVSINGAELMGTGDSNINKILTDLLGALNSNTTAASIEPFIGKLQSKQQDVLSLLADVGGRANRLDMMTEANSNDEINYTDVLSNAEDIDQAQVTMEFKMAEAVYHSALSVGARIIQPTLIDFLR